jgi:hypothetical protein
MKENKEEDISYLHEIATSGSEGMETDYMSGDCIDTMDLDEVKICDKPSVFSNRQKLDGSADDKMVESIRPVKLALDILLTTTNVGAAHVIGVCPCIIIMAPDFITGVVVSMCPTVI